MPYIIKSYHAPAPGAPRRMFFWQCPWIVPCNPYSATDQYGETVTRNSREIGGWVTWSGAATQYVDQQEAEAVNAIRYLGGTVTDAGKYANPPSERQPS